MSLLNYILILLSYHVNNKTLQTFDFLNYMHLPLKRTSSYKNTHTQLTNIPNNKIFETKRAFGSQLRTIADECTLYVIVLRHTFSGIWFSYRGERNLDYRCVYVVKNVICVKTGLDW